MKNPFHIRIRSRRGRVALVVGVAAAALAAPATAKLIEVGVTDTYPAPACPSATGCRVIAQITGYQIQIGAKKNPYRVTSDGRLVAFTLQLPQNSKDEIKFFNDNRGGAPSAQIAVLRPRPRKGRKYRYELVAKSERVEVQDYLGSNPTFPLTRTLAVKRNDIIAITTDTWLPAFSTAVDNTTVWRASRKGDECKDVDEPSAHTEKGQIRNYSCAYKAARLLYRANIVTTPKPTVKKTKN